MPDDDDPISNALLMQYGAYPDAAETGIDYTSMFYSATGAIDLKIDKNSAIPGDILKHPSVGFLPRHGLRRHYAVRPGWSFPGFFFGDADSNDDLVACWNLRAADIPVSFVDLRHAARYENILPMLKANYQEQVASLPERGRHLTIWASSEETSSLRTGS